MFGLVCACAKFDSLSLSLSSNFDWSAPVTTFYVIGINDSWDAPQMTTVVGPKTFEFPRLSATANVPTDVSDHSLLPKLQRLSYFFMVEIERQKYFFFFACLDLDSPQFLPPFFF